MKISVMQPTYLPWAGYFNLIKNCDYFVFLDDAKIEKSSWHVRNRILINDSVNFITIPIRSSRNNLIKDTPIIYDINWKCKHFKKLNLTYRKHPYGEEILELIHPAYHNNDMPFLSEFNINLINIICSYLGLDFEVLLSSDLNLSSTKSQKLIEICSIYNCAHYISPLGSRDYIEADGKFSDSNIQLSYQNYKLKKYVHYRSNQFYPRLSIIDVIANIGRCKTAEYILD